MGFYKNQSGPCASSTTPSTGATSTTTLAVNQSSTPNKQKNVKLLIIFAEVIHPTLHDLFTNLIWETKQQSESLKEFIFRQPSPLSNKKYKSVFDVGQRKKIDMDHQCDTFDISLYYKSYLFTAKYNSKLSSNPVLSDELRDKLKTVKDIRDNILHELLIVSDTDIYDHVKDLKLIMKDIFDIIGYIFMERKLT